MMHTLKNWVHKMGPHFFLEPHLKVVLTALMPHFDMNTSTHTHTQTHTHARTRAETGLVSDQDI